MAFGLKIRNNNNSLLIDDTFKSLALRSKTNTTLVGWSVDFPNLVAAGLTLNFEPALVAYTGTTVPVSIWSVNKVGSSWEYTFFSPRFWSSPDRDALNSPITFYVFGPPAAAIPPYGHVVWNSSGQMTFNSNEKYMRIAGQITSEANFAVPSGKTYATCIVDPGYSRNVTSVRNDYSYGSYRSGSNIITSKVSQLAGFTLPPPSPGMVSRLRSPNIMVLDVTGY